MENQFGKTSRLVLEAERREERTILSEVSFTAPFKIMQPFYEKKDFMTVMLLTASAGIMAGDRQEFEMKVKSGAAMEFVSQAYEKIHRMEEGYASRTARLTVESGGMLRYTPLPVIPFAGSDFRSELQVELEDEHAGFIMSEVLTCGREAHGEIFQYRGFSNRISIYQKGRLVYRDNTRYDPAQMDMTGLGMYEGFTHLGNMVLCNIHKPEEWFGQLREELDCTPDVEGGVTITAAGHIVMRILGKNARKLTQIMEKYS